MKYIRTKDGIYSRSKIICCAFAREYQSEDWNKDIESYLQTPILKQADTIEELCDSFEVVRWDGYTFKYKSYKEAYDRWFGDGYQNVSSEMYGLINGKRVAIMTGYTEGKNPDKLELELLKETL